MKELIDEKSFILGLNCAAGALFVVGAIIAIVWRKKSSALYFAGAVMLVGGPALWLLWQVYGGVVKHFGLDSVKGLWVNIVIFVVAGALVGMLLGFLRGAGQTLSP